MTDIKVITWNIDGLNPVETIKRTLEVCKIIKKEAPDVVLLQEVLNCTLNLISEECPDYIFLDAIEEGYTCLDENDENEDGSDDDDDDDDESIDDGILGGYFCITMLKRETVEVKEARVIPFTNSKQGRCLQKIECIIRGIPFVVMSSHFESCKEKSDERKHQFKRTLSHMINSKPDATVIFGGDTNLRNYEIYVASLLNSRMAIKPCDHMTSQRTMIDPNRILQRTTSVDNSKYKISSSVQVDTQMIHSFHKNANATSKPLKKHTCDVNTTQCLILDNLNENISKQICDLKDHMHEVMSKLKLSVSTLSDKVEESKRQLNLIDFKDLLMKTIKELDVLFQNSSDIESDLVARSRTKSFSAQEQRTKDKLLQENNFQFRFQDPKSKQKEEVDPIYSNSDSKTDRNTRYSSTAFNPDFPTSATESAASVANQISAATTRTTKSESDSSNQAMPHRNELTCFSNELTRLSTFHNFSPGINISAIRLAVAGFYKLDESMGHKTKCFSCGIEYDKWRSGDNPLSVHIKLSPHCSHVTQVSQNPHEAEDKCTGNNSDISSNIRTSSFVADNEVKTEQMKKSLQLAHKETTNTEKIEVHSPIENIVEDPRYPNYASMQARISSYRGWPSYLDQTAEQMASAGFLFAGFNDYTRCFQCGGGLSNWDVGDDPWIEHARWFPKCSYLRQNKGDRFIEKVQQKHAELMAEGQGANNSSLTTGQTSTQSSNQNDLNRSNGLSGQDECGGAIDATSRQDVGRGDQSDINQNLLGTIAARSVLEMGYSTEQVLTVYSKYKNKGKDLNTICATDIMRVLLDGDIEISPSQLPTEINQLNDKSNTENVQEPLQHNSETEHPKDKKDTSANADLENHLDDTEQLLQENRQLRDQMLCKVCLDLDATIAFLPCGHIVCCQDCAPAMRKCPICRTRIKGTVKTYLV